MTSLVQEQNGRSSPLIPILKPSKFGVREANKNEKSDRRKLVTDGQKRGRNRVYIHIISPGSLTPSYEKVSVSKSSSVTAPERREKQQQSRKVVDDETVDSECTRKATNCPQNRQSKAISDHVRRLADSKKTTPARSTSSVPRAQTRIPPTLRRRNMSAASSAKLRNRISVVSSGKTIPQKCENTTIVEKAVKSPVPQDTSKSSTKINNRRNISNQEVQTPTSKESAEISDEGESDIQQVTPRARRLAITLREANKKRVYPKKPLSSSSTTSDTAPSTVVSSSSLSGGESAINVSQNTPLSARGVEESSTMSNILLETARRRRRLALVRKTAAAEDMSDKNEEKLVNVVLGKKSVDSIDSDSENVPPPIKIAETPTRKPAISSLNKGVADDMDCTIADGKKMPQTTKKFFSEEVANGLGCPIPDQSKMNQKAKKCSNEVAADGVECTLPEQKKVIQNAVVDGVEDTTPDENEMSQKAKTLLKEVVADHVDCTAPNKNRMTQKAKNPHYEQKNKTRNVVDVPRCDFVIPPAPQMARTRDEHSMAQQARKSHDEQKNNTRKVVDGPRCDFVIPPAPQMTRKVVDGPRCDFVIPPAPQMTRKVVDGPRCDFVIPPAPQMTRKPFSSTASNNLAKSYPKTCSDTAPKRSQRLKSPKGYVVRSRHQQTPPKKVYSDSCWISNRV